MFHPMLATAELMNTLLAKPLGDQYRYLIPDIAGHGEASKQIYESAEKEAEAIYEYLMDHHITKIKLAFGASLGGVILLELLRKSDLEFGQLFFEGVSFYENAGFIAASTKFIMLGKHKKAVAHPEIAVEKMRHLYGEQAAQIMAEQMIFIQEKSLKHIVWDCSHVRLPQLSLEQQQRCVFAYGEKDGDLRAAMKVQPIKYPYAKRLVWPNHGHCTKITENNWEYAQLLKKYL